MGLNVVELWADLNKKIKKLSGSIDPTLPGKVADIEAVIPSGASSENQLATAGDVNRIDLSIEQLSGSVLDIQAVIPSGASSENKLATMSDVDKGYVEVTADGVKTFRKLFNELYLLADKSKVTWLSHVVDQDGIVYMLRDGKNGTRLRYTSTVVSDSIYITTLSVASTESDSKKYNSVIANSSGNVRLTMTDGSESVPTDGTKITLYY